MFDIDSPFHSPTAMQRAPEGGVAPLRRAQALADYLDKQRRRRQEHPSVGALPLLFRALARIFTRPAWRKHTPAATSRSLAR